MKKLLLSSVILATMTSSTIAANLPSIKSAPAAPAPLWTGFYAGLNAGYGFGTNNNTNSASISNSPITYYTGPAGIYSPSSSSLGAGLAMSGVSSLTQSGVIGGGQIGYSYQFSSNFVVGIEADMQDAGITGGVKNTAAGLSSQPAGISATQFHNLDSTAIGVTQVNAGVNWMGTLRARLGYLFTPTMLIYTTGGLTYGGIYSDVTNNAVSTSTSNAYSRTTGEWLHDHGQWNHIFVGGESHSSVLTGWNVGGGFEWMFAPNWSFKAEGIYWNMGSMNISTSAVAFAPTNNTVTYDRPSSIGAYAFGNTSVNYQGVIARAGVNYHFNFSNLDPVVAKF